MIDDLVERAQFEADLLARATPELALAAPTVAELIPAEDGATARVGGKKPARKKKSKGKGGSKPPSLKALSSLALSQEGVVRLDGVLEASTAASLRAEILERRAAAFAAVESGDDWRLYFADVLLKADRCDLLLPLKGNRGTQMALRELLVGNGGTGDGGGGGGRGGGGGGGGGGASTTLLHSVLGSTLGEDATLCTMWNTRGLGPRPAGARGSAPDRAPGCSEPRPVLANQPLGSRWPATPALFSPQALRAIRTCLGAWRAAAAHPPRQPAPGARAASDVLRRAPRHLRPDGPDRLPAWLQHRRGPRGV